MLKEPQKKIKIAHKRDDSKLSNPICVYRVGSLIKVGCLLNCL
jgi:hypothetical protein